MKISRNLLAVYGGILLVSLAIPFVFPNLLTQMAFLWAMIIFALTWDTMGGQMGYNSFGNIVFFGIGAYASAVLQRDLELGYVTELLLGMGLGGLLAVLVAVVIGLSALGLRGHYFAICTLGLSVAAGELAAGWEYIGAGSGMVTPVFPGEVFSRNLFFYFLLFALAIVNFFFLKWLYSTQFGLAINAIRDDEDKAEAMGIHTTRYKVVAWCISAAFLGPAGGALGNLIGFIDPRDVAFASQTFGVWMVLMAILGGSHSIWGPVIGATVFHITQELFWTYLLGWQRVALGLMIVVIVLFFPYGITGYARQRWPLLFGDWVQPSTAPEEAAEGGK